jgi:subtilisin family serine protease
VLNEDGLGDLFTLNAALHTFISDTVNAEPSPVAAIMNLSLGSSVWLDPEVPTEWQDWIFSLKTLIAAAHCNHMVVVTSAGNYPDAPQTPAVLEETIAVQGSNRDRAQSCFNSPVHVNAKWVRAPGGGDLDPAKCEPVLDQCIEGDCPYALIGMVLDGNGQVDYDYWSGTSFAAPLVSGLSALLLEQEGDSFSPDEVYERIKDCADLPNRIIDVPATLNGSCP